MIGFYLEMSKVRISAASKNKLEEKCVAENMCSDQNYIFLFLSKNRSKICFSVCDGGLFSRFLTPKIWIKEWKFKQIISSPGKITKK